MSRVQRIQNILDNETFKYVFYNIADDYIFHQTENNIYMCKSICKNN